VVERGEVVATGGSGLLMVAEVVVGHVVDSLAISGITLASVLVAAQGVVIVKMKFGGKLFKCCILSNQT